MSSTGPGKRGHIVADTSLPTPMFPRLPARNICCRNKFCVWDTKNVSDFVQKHFVSATNVSQFAYHGNTTFTVVSRACAPKKHHEKQCVRNNVSSFTRALTESPSVVFTSFAKKIAIDFY